jgi:predicted AAA+ superfamily ATPase
LADRTQYRELFPFDFQEHCSFLGLKPSNNTLVNYFNEGGFPFYLATKNTAVQHQLFRDILFRDVIGKHGIEKKSIVEGMAMYLISNTAKIYSINGLKKKFDFDSTDIAAEYLAWLEDSNLFFSLPRFGWSTKLVVANQKKVYTIDNGFARANSISLGLDKERLFENMIYLSIRRKHDQLYYFREKGECDFVIREKDKIVDAIQACYDLNEDNIQRELSGLKEAMDYFNLKEGTLITLSQEDQLGDENHTIHVIPAAKWMMMYSDSTKNKELGENKSLFKLDLKSQFLLESDLIFN